MKAAAKVFTQGDAFRQEIQMYMNIVKNMDPSESQLFPAVFNLHRAMADSGGSPMRALILELFPTSLSQHLAKCSKGIPFAASFSQTCIPGNGHST